MVNEKIKEKMSKPLNFGIDFAKKSGAEHCEGFGIFQKSMNLQLEKSNPKHSLGIENGLSFRVIVNNSVGFAYTTSFNEEDIKHSIQLAIQNAKVSKSDPDIQPFVEQQKTENELPIDPKILNLEVDEAAEVFEKLNPSELPKNIFFLQSMGQIMSSSSFLKNSSGLDVSYNAAGYALGIGFLSTHGFPNYDFHLDVSRKWGELNPNGIYEKALSKTLESAKPQTLNMSKELPIIFAPSASFGIFGGLINFVLNSLLKGNKAYRGETPYADRIGDVIAPTNFTLIDDPLHPKLLSSMLYDAEGVPTQKTEMIKNGVLQTYYLDTYYANKLNMESNGKSIRGGGMFGGNPVMSAPSIGNFNTVIEPGDSSLEEMISETKEGFMMKNLMGVHMSDFSSGRFAVTGGGFYIKDGEIKCPVQDISLSGDIPSLLTKIDLISKEREEQLISEIPYLRVSSLTTTAKKLDFKIRFGYKILKTLVSLGIVKNPFD